MVANAVVLVCVAAAALATPADARGSSTLWCPEAAQAEGLDDVLQRVIVEGRQQYGDSGVPENTPPPWMDSRKMAAARVLIQTNPMAIIFAHIQGLYMVMAVPSVIDVLVFTGLSDTPDKAWYRYFDTVISVGTWYSSDFFEPGAWAFEELRRVRGLHRRVRRTMNEARDQDAVVNRTRLDGEFSGCPAAAAMRRDLDKVADAACPFARRSTGDQTNTIDPDGGQDGTKPSQWMSQYDMAMTQWAFVAPVVLFPETYGMSNVTEKQLDSFVHLWRVLGYALGIEDRFNLCQGGLGPARERFRQVLSVIVLPLLRQARPPWEYMTRCMADGLAYTVPGADFNVQLETMLRDTLGAPVPSVSALLSPTQRTSLKSFRDVMESLRGGVRRHPAWPATLSPSDLIKSRIRPVFKDMIRQLSHREPYRSPDCYARIRT